jgi:glutathione S-transferase
MAITVYYSPMSSSTRAVWALEELGIPYDKVRVHLDKGEQKKPEYLKINPNGKVPALVDGDVTMFEAFAIILHLGERYGVEKGLWPKPGTRERAEALTWSVWAMTELQPAVVSYAMNTTERRFAFPKEQWHAPTAEMARKNWTHLIGILDARLQGREHIVGPSFTFCDVVVASLMGFAVMMAGLPLEGHANVSAWLARCQQRPAMGRAMSMS